MTTQEVEQTFKIAELIELFGQMGYNFLGGWYRQTAKKLGIGKKGETPGGRAYWYFTQDELDQLQEAAERSATQPVGRPADPHGYNQEIAGHTTSQVVDMLFDKNDPRDRMSLSNRVRTKAKLYGLGTLVESKKGNASMYTFSEDEVKRLRDLVT